MTRDLPMNAVTVDEDHLSPTISDLSAFTCFCYLDVLQIRTGVFRFVFERTDSEHICLNVNLS